MTYVLRMWKRILCTCNVTRTCVESCSTMFDVLLVVGIPFVKRMDVISGRFVKTESYRSDRLFHSFLFFFWFRREWKKMKSVISLMSLLCIQSKFFFISYTAEDPSILIKLH